MGNDNSVEVPAWGKNCKMFDKVDNRYGGAIQIWSEMNNHFARRDINIRSEEELKRMIAEINRRSILVHKRFSTVKNYQVIDQSDFCSRTHTLSLCFEYFDNDLSREVAKRAQTGNYFREQKICQILYQVCDCLWYLEQRGTFHGDIKPANIFFDQDQQVKLVDSYFTNLGRANFELVLSSPTCQSYLSPAQLEKLKRGNYEIEDNKYKNQIFSLGMTIMEAMLLKNSFECYEFNLLKIIDTKVMIKSAEMRQKYSNDMVRLVDSMLEIDENLRPSAGDLLKSPLLKPFNTKISAVGAINEQVKSGNGNLTIPISPPSHNISYSSSK